MGNVPESYCKKKKTIAATMDRLFCIHSSSRDSNSFQRKDKGRDRSIDPYKFRPGYATR